MSTFQAIGWGIGCFTCGFGLGMTYWNHRMQTVYDLVRFWQKEALDWQMLAATLAGEKRGRDEHT